MWRTYQPKKENAISIINAKIINETNTILTTFWACSSSFLLIATFFFTLPIIVSFKVQR
ncbi:hypothetical protein BSCG_02786 [Bacteroides sp. 2_2_4]|nr:hypothetical protein BSCG_02786 [Bacteroides sp. 2_2_4]